MMNRDDKYFYAKERRKFGRQCCFADHNELIFDEPPNRSYMNEYFLKNPVDSSTQIHKQYALSDCVTISAEMRARGMNHIEGGWPKDLNPFDEEQTTRQRKKIMREDIWGQKVPILLKEMEKSVLQNGAVNIYQNYFDDLEGIPEREEFSGKTVSIFKDKKEPLRPISNLTWSPDGLYIAGSYSMPKYMETAGYDPTSYIWNIENPNLPFLTLIPQTPIMSLVCNSRDQFLLAGGLLSGQVVIWDQRNGGIPVLLTEREIAHTERVNSLLWTSSKTNSELFSGSADGTVYFWDIRNLVEPTEQLCMDPVATNEQQKSRSYGVSVVEFEPTIPTRFMVGSDQGLVFSCNRKGRTPMEKIIAKFKTHTGCLYSLERNPAFPKNFLTIGDWTAKIWSDEWRDSPISWTPTQHVPVLSGTWSKTRCSLFFITTQDGSFEAWDLLLQQDKPVMRIKLTPTPLFCTASHENGELAAVAGDNGFIYLVRLSDNMVPSSKVERPAFSFMVERETRREKAFDSRLREVKLKIRKEQEKAVEEAAAKEKTATQDDAAKLVSAESEKQATVEEEETPPPTEETAEGEVVVDLVEQNEKDFYHQLEIELKKRESYEVVPVISPFEPGFDVRTFMKPEDAEEHHREHMNEIKSKVIKGLLDQNKLAQLL